MHDSEQRVCDKEGGTERLHLETGKNEHLFVSTCYQAAEKLRRPQGTVAGV